jgi:hypothetical protein
MKTKVMEATTDDVPFAALGGSKRALLPLVASRGASDVRTLAQEEAAAMEAEDKVQQADEALVLG